MKDCRWMAAGWALAALLLAALWRHEKGFRRRNAARKLWADGDRNGRQPDALDSSDPDGAIAAGAQRDEGEIGHL